MHGSNWVVSTQPKCWQGGDLDHPLPECAPVLSCDTDVSMTFYSLVYIFFKNKMRLRIWTMSGYFLFVTSEITLNLNFSTLKYFSHFCRFCLFILNKSIWIYVYILVFPKVNNILKYHNCFSSPHAIKTYHLYLETWAIYSSHLDILTTQPCYF